MCLRAATRTLALLLGLWTLGACDSAEERAEKHFQNGMALLAAGDTDRALVEFRNVFKLDGQHKQARKVYAREIVKRGNMREGYGQYLRLIEQHPEDGESRLELAELAIRLQNWSDARKHGTKAQTLLPEDPRGAVIGAALAYQQAIRDNDAPARRAALQRAMDLRGSQPDNDINQNIVIDGLLRDHDHAAALAMVETALAQRPKQQPLHLLRLQILSTMGRDDQLAPAMRAMIDAFPEDLKAKGLLVRHFLDRNDPDSAEAFLRSRITQGVPDDEPRITLVEFLHRNHGRTAARAELEALVAEGTNPDRFRAMLATFDFQDGQRAQAIATLDAILEQAPESTQKHDIMVIQARFLLASGNEVGARRLVEEILAKDATMVEALKLRANWLISGDQADAAINVLRVALDQSPQDPDLMTLMARAHRRNGNHDLSAEMLSLAVKTAENAPAETLRYTAVLLAEGKYETAESLLLSALRRKPEHLGLLRELGRVYVGLQGWTRARNLEARLRAMGRAQALKEADILRMARLDAQARGDEALAALQDLARDSGAQIGPQATMVRAHLIRNDIPAARQHVNRLLAQRDSGPAFRFLDAAVLIAEGRPDLAEARYREILTETPEQEQIWMHLIRLLAGLPEREEDLRATLAQALEVLPEGRDLLWMKASYLERDGNTEGAIAIYEKLYAQNSDTAIVANNLASLLATTRSDEDSLNRAYTIARRLRDSDFAPFQNTYGWIAYRRGHHDEALRHLEPAAAGLPDDPLVQYHLAMAYLATNQPRAALGRFEQALQLAGNDPRPQFAQARAEIARLSSQN